MPYRMHHRSREFARASVFRGAFNRFDIVWIDQAVRNVPPHVALTGDRKEEHAETRSSVLRWLPAEEPWLWLYQRLNVVIDHENELHWGYELTEMQDLQYTEYVAPAGHYTWHQDSGGGMFAGRKLSASVVLTDPSEHGGGAFEIFEHGPIDARRGDVIVFPAHEQHRVTPVTSGVRRSLVVWCVGPGLR